MQTPNELMLTAQECAALADMVSSAPAQGSQMKRQHLAIEEKLLKLARHLVNASGEKDREDTNG